MSQEQPRRPDQAKAEEQEPIRYRHVFPVSGDLANKPITTQDAATMQSAESLALGLGHIHKGGPASLMQSAASVNRNRNLLAATADQGVTVSHVEVAGHHIITESIGGQVVAQYPRTGPAPGPAPAPSKSGGEDLVTIGEALEAAGIAAGEKPVEQSDASAIQAAEVRATGRMQVMPGGVAAKAQVAASQNARTVRDEDKTKLGDVLADASMLLAKDKVVTREDAEGVIGAEIRNQPELACTYPGGVAASMAAASRLNQNNN